MGRLAAALSLVLLPFGVPVGEALAQDDTTQQNKIGQEARQTLRTVENTATAQWNFAGAAASTTSNTVTFDVTLPPPEIRAFRPASSGTVQLNFPQPVCNGIGRSGEATGTSPGGADPSRVPVVQLNVDPTRTLIAGQMLTFEVVAFAANTDPGAVDALEVDITTSSGDRERETVFETGVNTGIFVGQIDTVRMPPVPAPNDCRLSLANGTIIEIAAMVPGGDNVLVQTAVDVLADPFGIVFDSETGEPVNGVRVTLIDDATGQPATVFAEDGETPWPSTVISGQAITDGSGRITQMGTGEFWFPQTFIGRYRLEFEAPQPYSGPSVVEPVQIAQITRPDGRGFVIDEGSYGGAFDLPDPTPVQVDIPLDRDTNPLGITKTASRANAMPGDVVFYSITAANTDPARLRRNVTLTDTPSRWLRLRPDTVKINGEAAGDAVEIAPDGSSMRFDLGTLSGGASTRITYAMSVRADASPGRALNDAVVTDLLGRTARAQVPVEIERETIADRMTIMGRVTAGACTLDDPRPGIAGVRVMLEDGSFAITDADGRYHFEGVVPGTHVVAISRMTLPDGAELIDCQRGTRNAGSASSRFVIGQGGSLVIADFHASVPEGALADVAEKAETTPDGSIARAVDAAIGNAERGATGAEDTAGETVIVEAAPLSPEDSTVDYFSMGDGPDGFLSPTPDANPRAPAVKVAIRHRKGQKIDLRVDGEPVNPLTFDGTANASDGQYAISLWRGVPLVNERTVLEADIINSFGMVNQTVKREVFFTRTPAKVELVPELSNLVADGRTRPVVAIRVLDRNNRPLREGIAGQFSLNAPYESAEQLDRQQLDQLTAIGGNGGSNAPSSARWVTQGEKGIALIELAPTMVSGSLRLNFGFDDGEIERQQELEAWIEPGDIEWTIVGLAEGTVGARSVADNMERAGRFDSDLGDDARVALYAKGRVLGKYLVTLAYDSAKQREDQRVLGTIDPNAYYTVFADGSLRRFDAASREKLYVRIETATFYALYGDFITAFDQTRLARYNRTATGVKAEARFGQIKAQAFAADVATRLQRQEIQGQGISGPYELGTRRILPNSERVTIEVRDRLRSDIIVERRQLTRFIDYDLDLLTGSITFSQPVLSRDDDLNPQFIIVEYEVDGAGQAEMNAGVRADWTSGDGRVRVGATAITDANSSGADDARTNIAALDVRAQLGDNTEVRAEVGVSRREGEAATGWIIEAQHQTATLDVLAYARQLDADYGIGQQNVVEQGRRKIGADARVLLNERLSVLTSLWQDESLVDNSRRRAVQTQLNWRGVRTDLRAGLAHFNDTLADGSTNTSTVFELGGTQRLFDGALEVSAATAFALDDAESTALPATHRFGVRYQLAQGVRLVGSYDIASGENIDARQLRGGIEVAPWRGGQIVTSLGQDTIGEFGNRSFAAFGLAQSLALTPELTIDATLDGSRTLGGAPDQSDQVNPLQPAPVGGQLTGGLNFEDFTAATLGAAWRKDRWSLTARGEYRDGELADRLGASLGAIRQLGGGSIVGSGITWTRAENTGGSTTEILDASLAFAHRPDASEIAMLGKLEFRSDAVRGGVNGGVAGAGRTALIVDGDATSRRLIASLSSNWSPRGWDEDENGIEQQTRRDEYSLFLGARYNFDQFEGTEFAGTALLAGLDARIGITDMFEIGAMGTLRANLEDEVYAFAFGPMIGISPTRDVLLTIGYNIEGFRDGDFAAARNTDKGIYAAVRMKFDADTFRAMGLGGR